MATLEPPPAPAAQPAPPPSAHAAQQPATVVARVPWSRPDGSGAPGEIVLRRYAGERELPAIMALMAAELSEPYSIFTFRHFVDGWPELCFVAYDGDRLIGAIVNKAEYRARNRRTRGYVAMLAVEKEYRKSGLGQRLAATGLQAMCETCDEIVLEAEESNVAALRLYERLGFTRDKRLPAYYLNGSDAFRLKVVLKP